MSRDGFRTEDVEDEDAWGRVNVVVERDESGVFGVGMSWNIANGDERPGPGESGERRCGRGEGSDGDITTSGASGIRLKESEGGGASIIIFRLKFTGSGEEGFIGGVGIGDPGGESVGGVTMLEDVNSGGFGDDLRERL
jgi:hypothetical protein